MSQTQTDAIEHTIELGAEQISARAAELGISARDLVLEMLSRLPGETPAQQQDPPPPKVSRTIADNAPKYYDQQLGLVMPGPPDPAPTAEEQQRWLDAATALVPLLGSVSGYRDVMPLARLNPENYAKPRVGARLARALPELEALRRKLLPGWREIVLSWLQAHADKRVEDQYRPAFANRKPVNRAGHVRYWNEAAREEQEGLVNLAAQVELCTGEQLLEQLRSNPPELMGSIPSKLTAEVLDAAAAIAGRPKVKGTREPETLLSEIEALSG